MHHLWGSNFLRKCSKFNLHFETTEKSWEKVFPFRDNSIWVCWFKLFLLRREYFWPAVNVLKNSPEVLSISKRDFFELHWVHSGLINMVKVVSFIFQHSLIPFTFCLSNGPVKRDSLDIYLTTFFGIRNFGNTSALSVIFFWKCSKFYLQCKNTEKNSENVFPFRDKCISLWCVKLPLLRRKYFWPAVNVLKNSPEIIRSLRETFPNLIIFTVINKYGKRVVL